MKNTDNLKSDMLASLKTGLKPDEELLWHGFSKGGIDRTDVMLGIIFIVIFDAIIFVSTFIVFNEMEGPTGNLMMFLSLVIPLVIGGLLFVRAPYLGYKNDNETIYGITTKRAIIISPQKVESINAPDMCEVTSARLKSGRGHVFFYKKRTETSNGNVFQIPQGFFNIENPQEAEMHLNKIKGK